MSTRFDLDRDRLAALVILAASVFAPNISLLVGGFRGFYLTYFTWAILLAVAIPLLTRSGKGSLLPQDSAVLGLLLVTGISAIGLLLGFDARVYPRDAASLSISLGLFLVQALGVEVGRSASMCLTKHTGLRVAVGTIAGIALGRTALALLSYVADVYGRPLFLLEDLLYSLALSMVHEYGGLFSGLAFRLVVDGYWRFSPLVLTTRIPSVLRSAVLVLAYYCVIILIVAQSKSLKGSSRELFEFSRFKKVLRVLPEVSLVAIALTFLVLAFNRYVPLVVASGSMAPTLSVGDIVFVHVEGGENIEVGDIVAYAMEGRQVVVHRVVSVEPGGVRTKGDANPDPDPFLVDYREILGKAVFVIPRLGYIAIAFQAGGQVAYLSIAGFAVLALSLVMVRRSLKSRKFKLSLEM